MERIPNFIQVFAFKDLNKWTICFLNKKNKIIYGIIIKKRIPVFRPLPTVKSSLLLVIIWALHVEQHWEIEGNEYITAKHRKAILYKVFNCNKALSWNKQQHL